MGQLVLSPPAPPATIYRLADGGRLRPHDVEPRVGDWIVFTSAGHVYTTLVREVTDIGVRGPFERTTRGNINWLWIYGKRDGRYEAMMSTCPGPTLEDDVDLPDNDFDVMPHDIRQYNGNNDRCDLLVGPCACGAWHRLDEWPRTLLEHVHRTAFAALRPANQRLLRQILDIDLPGASR